MNENMLISVIMPVYNAELFLGEAIKSILNQTYKNFEFIIIDDGSTDKSYEIIRSYNDKRIIPYKQDNRGVAVTLNKGISLSSGDIIARQDADDISLHNRFEKQINYLQEHPDIYLLGTCAELVNEQDNKIRDLIFPCQNNDLQNIIKQKNPFIHGSIFIKRQALKEVGIYREQFLLAQSYDLWLRISEKFKIANLPEQLYHYRLWDKCVSNEKAALFDLFSEIAIELHKERMNNGRDILMSGNNYEFYNKYGKNIVKNFEKKELFRWLR